jgi:hypothetical protein
VLGRVAGTAHARVVRPGRHGALAMTTKVTVRPVATPSRSRRPPSSAPRAGSAAAVATDPSTTSCSSGEVSSSPERGLVVAHSYRCPTGSQQRPGEPGASLQSNRYTVENDIRRQTSTSAARPPPVVRTSPPGGRCARHRTDPSRRRGMKPSCRGSAPSTAQHAACTPARRPPDDRRRTRSERASAEPAASRPPG